MEYGRSLITVYAALAWTAATIAYIGKYKGKIVVMRLAIMKAKGKALRAATFAAILLNATFIVWYTVWWLVVIYGVL